MMQFCFLAKIVPFPKVAQNLSSRLKRGIESRTQQHTMSQFSSLEERCHMYTKLMLDLPVGIFVPVEYQLHMTVCPKHRDAYGIHWRTSHALNSGQCRRPHSKTAISRLTNWQKYSRDMGHATTCVELLKRLLLLFSFT